MAASVQERSNTEHQDTAELLYNNSSSGILVTLFAASFLVFSYHGDDTATFKYTVISEGIETQQQAEILSELGIEMLQGYHFAKSLEQSKVKNYIEYHSS